MKLASVGYTPIRTTGELCDEDGRFESMGNYAGGKVEAVLFDFDGTLVDTMPLHFEAYRRAFERAGVVLSPEDFYSNIGGKASETIPKFLRGRTARVGVEELHREKKRILLELIEEKAPEFLESAKLVGVFKSFVPVALVSSGARQGIDRILARLDSTALFDVIVCGEDAPRGKPAPDLFLEAAGRLHVRPSECLVFEDTDDGVAAARAAGMRYVDVRRMVPRSYNG